jgi:chloramphenicol 3-O-phosphotransferase
MAVEPIAKMYKAVKKMADKGHNVVVEAPTYLWDGVDCLSNFEALQGADVTYVLAYCPWNDLVERIKQRNASKDKKLHRELDWALINFIHTFNISRADQGKDCLERLSGDSVHRFIMEYIQQQQAKKQPPLLDETRAIVLNAFPNRDECYFIYPRFNYDVYINTKEHSPDEGAALVLDYIGV